ncbi:MAG: IS3 family transposase [Phycisphaerales bacterium]|nr:IS3 family transposase [Phycisphaerales bacterium]
MAPVQCQEILPDTFAGPRRIVGRSMRERMTSDLVIDALAMAVEQRHPPSGIMHHSDRGSQYTSHAFQAMLAAHGMVCSMSRKGEVYDNAVIESFYATLKRELVKGSQYATRDEARRAIFEWIEVFYNRQRLHSSLGCIRACATRVLPTMKPLLKLT